MKMLLLLGLRNGALVQANSEAMAKALEAICQEVPPDSSVLDLHAGGA
jgi:rhamnogalacturonyl hydrolase YesR